MVTLEEEISHYKSLKSEQLDALHDEVVALPEMQIFLMANKNTNVDVLTYENAATVIEEIPENEVLNSVPVKKRLAFFMVLEEALKESTVISINQELIDETGYNFNVEYGMEDFDQFVAYESAKNKAVSGIVGIINTVYIKARERFYKDLRSEVKKISKRNGD